MKDINTTTYEAIYDVFVDGTRLSNEIVNGEYPTSTNKYEIKSKMEIKAEESISKKYNVNVKRIRLELCDFY